MKANAGRGLAMVWAVVGAVAIPSVVQAQAVQLPTFNYFSGNTTVLVPDGGSVYLGGVNRSASGRATRGIPGLGARPFRNVGIGRSTSGGGLWVSAQIHDMEAMDRAILGQNVAAGSYASRPQVLLPREPNFNDSIASIRAEAASEDLARQQEAIAYLQRARAKLDEGQSGLAKIYFQMAARRASGETKQQALAGLATVEQPPADAVAEGRP